jgi:hypothetical protein
VQVPAGAHDVRLSLKQHEDFVFGTAFEPESIEGAAGRVSLCCEASLVGPIDVGGMARHKWIFFLSCFGAVLSTHLFWGWVGWGAFVWRL